MIKKLLIIICAIGTASLSLAYRLGGMSPSDFIDASPDKPMGLNSKLQVLHPDTLIKQAEHALEQDNPELAKELTLKALSKNITNGLAFAQLVAINTKKNSDYKDTEKLAQLAEVLWPAHIGVQSKLAEFWLQQHNLPKLIHAWHLIMVRAPEVHQEIYPILFKLLDFPETIEVLKSYTANPPSWWQGLLNYTATQEQALQQLRTLYELREHTLTPLTAEERSIFIYALVKNKLWEEAYFTWLAGLNEKQLQESGFIYNGSFEAIEKTPVFDWQYSNTPSIKITTAPTNGMIGQKALHLILTDRDRVDFQHISQITKLNAGVYTLTLNYRIDHMQTGEGLRWRIYCMNDKNTLLGESTALNKRSPWDVLKVDFEVPTSDCAFQIVRLEASSPFVNNHLFKGSLWFDGIQITRTQPKP
ncbi:hypothetical protein [uncultured Thiothrix sp.]|uniref:tetratricopeptide repeat protein n=1 Tax=uncultured Thiothrix sp. TaxID=223185 RepID=UPI00261FB167|nr:hypothetical protein [uncultured Thiothrix sp.]